MGKKKNKNKVSGAVKTAQKTEKKLQQKLKKELANMGEEDISKVLAEIEREDAKRSGAVEKTLAGAPSARAYATLIPHPTNNELIMFGGEYHDGQKTKVYSDLYFYNPVTNVWRQVKAPGGPPPRSAHQAVATPANKGEVWIFGGEFTSPSETQFHHFKDLWCFSLADKKWEKVSAPGGPSSRSGHRMVQVGRKLLTFGGYTDDGRDCRYHDDLYSFCLDTRTWSKVETSGRGPAPRSACLCMPVNNDSLVVYGGFSRIKDGKTERGATHGDMFRLVNKDGRWMWKSISAASSPLPRASLAAGVNVLSNRAYVFGGVADVEETDEEVRGELTDTLQMLDLEAARWHQVTLKCDNNMEVETKAVETPKEDMDVTVVTDEVFTMKLGGAPSATDSQQLPTSITAKGSRNGPTARMSAMMCVHRSVLYLYGGVLEKDDKQFYLSDMYSLDLHKLNEWKTIIEQPKLPEWLGSSDSEYETESGSGSGDSGSESE